jgi:hypothetical protein
MDEIEITNFELTYDGMYFIKWDNYEKRVFLELNTILKMLEIEGLEYKDVNEALMAWKPLQFKKVVMKVFGEENNGKLSLMTSDFSDLYLGKQNLNMIDIGLKE